MCPSRAVELRWAAGALAILAQKIAETGDGELFRAHLLCDSAIGLLELMSTATDESATRSVRTKAYRKMGAFCDRVEAIFGEA